MVHGAAERMLHVLPSGSAEMVSTPSRRVRLQVRLPNLVRLLEENRDSET